MTEPGLAFQRRQQAFADYIRDPRGAAPPAGIEPRRLALYARLVYNNIEGVLARTFSVCHGLVPKAAWHCAVRSFVREHRAESPYFSHIPAEFLACLADRPLPAGWPPFAHELCHYEWTKLALDLAEDEDCAFDDDEIAEEDALRLSPLARLLEYEFPVHAIDGDNRPAAPPPESTRLVAWRDRQDRVRFLRVNAATMRLLQAVGQGRTAAACLAEVASSMARPPGKEADALLPAGLAMLTRLHRRDIVLRRAA